MSLGQTMISTAFFALLTLAVLTANRMIIENSRSSLKVVAIEGATNLANSLLTEILTKKFDSQVTTSDGSGTGTVTGPYVHTVTASGQVAWPWPSTPTKFDLPSAMGPAAAAADYVNPGGAADVAPFKSIKATNGNYFDDVDDYHGYKRSASSGSITGYILTVSVYYVKISGGKIITSPVNQTYYKEIDVTVSNSIYLPTSLKFSAIATY